MTMATLIKENISLGLAYSFSLVCYQDGSMVSAWTRADVLEKGLRVLHPDPQATNKGNTGTGLGFGTPEPPHSNALSPARPHLFQ